MNTKTIQVDYLARVEGEGAFFVKIQKNRVTEARLNIFEPPRFFEAFLRERTYTEAPDITARMMESDGDCTTLLEAWKHVDMVILVDAASSGATPGTIYRVDIRTQALPEGCTLSSH